MLVIVGKSLLFSKRTVFLALVILSFSLIIIAKPEIVTAGAEVCPQNINLVQVVENVDLVKNKKTLAIIEIFSISLSGDVTVNFYLNNTFVNSTVTTINPQETKNVSMFFTPDIVGNNIEIMAVVSPGGCSLTIQKNIIETRELKLTYVPVDNPSGFRIKVDSDTKFIQKVYPLADDGLDVKNATNINSAFNNPIYFIFPSLAKLAITFAQVYKASVINGEFPERAVGIVPNGWFQNNIGFNTIEGMALGPLFPSVIVERRSLEKSASAHELGHTYFLCEEYSDIFWVIEDIAFNLIGNGCGNGDRDNNSALDTICLNNDGCPTFSFEPLTGQSNSTQLKNFMGSFSDEEKRWVADDTYNTLLSHFSHSSPETASKRIIISGFYNKSDQTANFENFYEVGEGLTINQSNFISGNFTLEVMENSTLTYNITFDLSFRGYFDDGNSTELNYTSFVFVIPFNENITQFIFKENTTTKDIVNVSENKPNVTLLSPNGGEYFSNEGFSITWNASDIDDDNLSYAVLISQDNGSTFTTIIMDYNETYLTTNSSIFVDSKENIVKVLATDGVNTAEDISDSVFEIDNDLIIIEFNAVYSNQTERVFKIGLENNLGETITNISWEFNTGINNETSQFDFSLKASEEILLFFYHNYSTLGNYTVIFTAFTAEISETESIIIEVGG